MGALALKFDGAKILQGHVEGKNVPLVPRSTIFPNFANISPIFFWPKIEIRRQGRADVRSRAAGSTTEVTEPPGRLVGACGCRIGRDGKKAMQKNIGEILAKDLLLILRDK